jgi:site-specific DNA-methyltransferase (adenine-specific)
MKINHIYHGDCIEVMINEIIPGSVNLAICDVPYNLSGKDLKWEEKSFTKVNEAWDTMTPEVYADFTDKWIDACSKTLAHNGSMFVCCSKHNIAIVDTTLRKHGLTINNIIVWFKTNPMVNMTGRTFTHASEFIIWAVKGPGWVYNKEEAKKLNSERTKDGDLKAMRDVWILPSCSGKERIKGPDGKAAHKTQKPEILMERIIRICSNSTNSDGHGDLVMDLFCGSGTTLAVCKKLGNRRWIGIELDPTYVKMSEERLARIEPSALQIEKL